MKDIVTDRLNKIEDLEQRKLLKNIMTGVFLNLVDYQEEMNRKLEEKVFNEITGTTENLDIYVTVCSRDELDPIHEFLYPMIPGDAERKSCNMRNIVSKLSAKEEVHLLTLFLQCDFVKIKELASSHRIFHGEMITTEGQYRIQVSLQQNKTYMDEIEKLYNIFQKNGIAWRTVNHPYANKFFDAVLVGYEGTLKEEEEIQEIRINLEEYEEYKRLNMIPLWNIERVELKNLGFPIPAMDKVNFEHILSLRKPGVEHGYLVDGEEEMIRYIKRTPEELIVVSPQEKSGVWNVLKVTQPVSAKNNDVEYELVSNKRKNSFMDAFIRKQAITVRAKGEISRIIYSFEATKDFELDHIEIKEQVGETTETYNMNPFISDHVRSEKDKKVMKLRFRVNGDNSFIRHDILSFLVSEIQMYFPEYKCEGDLS
ncbi:normocyte-binding protein [Aneurinibacillus migulanus]|uniref:normocyte-binding protein n=1 Tax=Aneurinibacillus migulanus TaxID=47500 RepID=UPI002E21B213|nr:normocyte-binding protein [Aneurinibacillus migulanus]